MRVSVKIKFPRSIHSQPINLIVSSVLTRGSNLGPQGLNHHRQLPAGEVQIPVFRHSGAGMDPNHLRCCRKMWSRSRERDPRLDWGNSDFDIAHRFLVSPSGNSHGQKKGSPSAPFFGTDDTKSAILFLTLFAKQLNTTLGVCFRVCKYDFFISGLANTSLEPGFR
jgi:hypothetical protein